MINFIINSITQLIIATIPAFLAYHFAVRKVQKNMVLGIKKNAIQKALDFLDIYYAWSTFEDVPSEKIVKPDIDIKTLTMDGRKLLNNLCLACKNVEPIQIFTEILFSAKSVSISRYDDFRQACRKELGLKKVKTPKEWIFIARIATQNLEKCNAK